MAFGDILEEMHDAEIELFRSVNLAGTNGVLDAVMLLFTFLGISYVIVLICIPLWIRGRKEAAFDAVIIVVIATLAAEIVKLIVNRERPYLELDDVKTLVSASGPSFPSAHATRAFAIAYLVFVTEPRRFGLTALLLAALISFSRIYLGVHWPFDVLAGAVLGVLIAFGMIECAKRFDSYKALRRKIISMLSGKAT